MPNIVKKIKEIKFSLLSPSEIKAISVAEIIYPEIVDTNGENKIGGLSDPRMGPIDLNTLCPTCNQTCDICPGHFGHIELAEPVFHIHFFQIIQKLLRCICWKCSNLLINPNDHPKEFSVKNNKVRFHLIYKLVTKNKGKIEKCIHCGYPQPQKYYKDKTKSSVAKIIAKFDDDDYVFTPNTIYRIFSHISDDTCNLIGFNYILSRPEWTICKILPVPPPAVRPSVKPDSQTHAEDDLTHKLAEIIKINNQVKQRIEQNYDEKIINQYIDVLQYHIATYVDNELPNTPQSEQRSGRPLKGIIQRLKGKHGRIRGNLMGKRVNFSGRSVITGDPNIEVDQVGIPFEIAMNLTFPETVTEFNKKFLYTLITNGPNKHPGANSIQSVRQNGQLNKPRDLTYINDRSTIILNIGDIVNRHLVDDDIILFNRQPSLHRMSMMGHRVKVMKGKSFRMNVNACPPYNSDFDGDEMNIHVPQSYQTIAELRQLAYLPNHMINPKHNTPILGCNFDFIVGSYLLTQDSVKFDKKTFMELAGWIKDFDGDISKIIPDSNGQYSGKQLYSLIIPNINLNKRKNTEDLKNLFIENGNIKSGVVDKKTIGKSASGIVHILWNDYGPLEAKKFIDNVAYVVNNYLLKIGFSVGISDIIPEKDIKDETNRLMEEKLSEVQEIINKANSGILKKVSNKTTFEDFETQLIGVLGTSIQVTGEYALNNIKKDNRVKRLVDSGSKGSSLNIAQMLAGLGQQSIENTRIPRGMNNRTLPHYFKYDVGTEAGGFIKNSYMDGLSPQEYYFHAISGRIGMIDTAIKTAKTGYITRKLVKAVEDVEICYDTTVRNSTNSIVQFIYGDDGFDSQKLEPINYPPLKISNNEFNNLYNYSLNKNLNSSTKKIVDNEFKQLQEDRFNVRNGLFHKNKEFLYNQSFLSPIVFTRLIKFIKNNIAIKNPTKLTPEHVINTITNLIKTFKNKITLNYKSNNLLSEEFKNTVIIKFAMLLRIYYSSKQLIDLYKLSKESFDHLILETKNKFYKAIVQPGDMVGVIAAHSASESTMQMTLNTFHYTGISSKSQTTTGVPRITEIISLSKNLKIPSMTIYIKNENPESIINSDDSSRLEYINKIKSKIEYTSFKELVNNTLIIYEPDINNICIEEDKQFIQSYLTHFSPELDKCSSPWTLRVELNREKMVSKNITLSQIDDIITNNYSNAKCIYSDENAAKIILRITLEIDDYKYNTDPYDIDIISFYEDIEKDLLNNLKINGIDGIENVNPYPDDIYYIDSKTGEFKISKKDKKAIWMMDTTGTNLKELYKIPEINPYKSITNSITEVYEIFGIEGARQVLINELHQVISAVEKSIDYRHITLIADHMTNKGILTSIDRHGMNQTDKGPLTRASFEETSVQLINAATFCEIDNIKGVTANIMTGQLTPIGTGDCNIVLDESLLGDISDLIEKNNKEKQNYMTQFNNLNLSKSFTNVCKNIFNFNFSIDNNPSLNYPNIPTYTPLVI